MRHVGFVLLPPLLIIAGCKSSSMQDDAGTAPAPNEVVQDDDEGAGGDDPAEPSDQPADGQDVDSFLAQEAARLSLLSENRPIVLLLIVTAVVNLVKGQRPLMPPPVCFLLFFPPSSVCELLHFQLQGGVTVSVWRLNSDWTSTRGGGLSP